MTNKSELLALKILRLDEGFRSTPYYCTEMFPTYGHGFKCGNKNDQLPNISIKREDSEKLLAEKIQALHETIKNKDFYVNLCDERKAVILSMAYQLGITGLLKFNDMIEALKSKDFALAGDCALDSLAARQAPMRWHRNANMLRTGIIEKYY